MKKYWLSIGLSVFIAASIGTYYIGAATRELPEYRMQTVEGDGKEASHLFLEGSVSRDKMIDQIKIGDGGTAYESRMSTIGKMFDSEYADRNPELAGLIKDHKGFMRGKKSYNGFYKDERQLVYAVTKSDGKTSDDGLHRYSLAVSALDLKSGKEKQFKAAMLGKQRYASMYVIDVQSGEDGIKVLVQLDKKPEVYKNGNYRFESELHVLTVNMDKEGISDDQTIGADSGADSGKMERYSVPYGGGIELASPSSYALVYKTVVKIAKDQDGNEMEQQVGSEIFAYDYANGKLTPILAGSGSDSGVYRSLAGNAMITMAMKGNALSIGKLELAKNKESLQFEIPMSLKNITIDNTQFFIYQSKLYMYVHAGADHEILVVSLTDGKVLYQGKATVDGTADEQKERLTGLNVYGFYFAS
ncbi:hypothetical protein [Paenibacillus sacheonensis]|uniref:Uncharacterized protein n=1 Tax=Paenibacillus sacheonensis TaxID=742054 RepID=A0A7X4YTI1_9BACL|nr:hypothetical protein [Paenibacillus sacheonensis]MBM7565722.1 hypothetical protein [Paenibacillus sacheonensis]NBC72220.1 hypothetical protein [Paenibacillus sacheonensis]